MLFILQFIGLVASATSASWQLCENCLQEPFELDYFGPLGSEIPKFTNISSKEFWKAAVLGKVLVVSDALKGAAFEGWTCDTLVSDFPNSKHRREYDWKRNPNDENRVRMGDPSWTTRAEYGVGTEDSLKKDPEVPPYAPFYWAIREHRQGCRDTDVRRDCAGPQKEIDKFRAVLRKSVPYFLDPQNSDALFDYTEVWSGAQDAGARAHMDSHCMSSLQYLLSGQRRWRISHLPRMPRGAGKVTKDVVFDDGVVYPNGWTPSHQTVVEEGSALFWPPGWIHETKNLAPQCHLAVVTQFTIPAPIHYFRNFYNRVMRIGDLQGCWADIKAWANLGGKLPKQYPRYAKAMEMADQMFEKLDGDKDGILTLAEFKQGVPAGRRGLVPPIYEGSFLWYDLDLDEQVTRVEFTDTFGRWCETEFQIRKEKELRPDKLPQLVDLDMAHYVNGTSKTEL